MVLKYIRPLIYCAELLEVDMGIGAHEVAGTSLRQIIYDYMCKKAVRKIEQNYKNIEEVN